MTIIILLLIVAHKIENSNLESYSTKDLPTD